MPGAVEDARVVLATRGIGCTTQGDAALRVDAHNGQAVAALEALRQTGIAVRSFEVERPTLEELFLEVVRRGR